MNVIVWSPDGDAVARPPRLQDLSVALDDEMALPRLVNSIRERTSLNVAVVALAATEVHVELIEPRPGIAWSAPDIEIPGHAPWYELGWYSEVCTTIERTLRDRGIECSGYFEQRKHWSISAILKVPTTAGELWFKQVPDFMAHEGRVMQWLSSLEPGAVPEVVDIGPDWCITHSFPSPNEEPTTESPFGLLGQLQQRAASRIDELLALGCPDRRTPSLLMDIESLAGRDDVLEIEQRHAVLNAVPALRERCARLDDGPVPSSLVHGDLHGGNWTRAADGHWVIFDWTDACIAHPFVDLGVLPSQDERLREARLRSYLDAWGVDEHDGCLVSDALAVAAAHHAVSYQRIVDGVQGDDGPSWHPAVRSHLDHLLRALAD